MDVPYRIRPAAPADLAQVAEIERRVFSDPWPEAGFHGLLGPFADVAVMGDGTVAGYVFGRRAVDEAEILNVAVRPECQRTGVGSALVHSVLRELHQAGARRVFLEVRETNAVAQAFYRGLGFRPVGRRRGYYSHPREDALILAREMPRSEQPA